MGIIYFAYLIVPSLSLDKRGKYHIFPSVAIIDCTFFLFLACYFIALGMMTPVNLKKKPIFLCESGSSNEVTQGSEKCSYCIWCFWNFICQDGLPKDIFSHFQQVVLPHMTTDSLDIFPFMVLFRNALPSSLEAC